MTLDRATETILVLDDVQLRREAVSRMLKVEGYRVVPARSGVEAQWLFEKRFGGFSQATIASFHNRCNPADIRSFMRSYRLATLWKTSLTRGCFSPSPTFLKP